MMQMWTSAGGRTAQWEVVEPHSQLEVTVPPGAGGQEPIQVWVGQQAYQMRCSLKHKGSVVEYAPASVISCTQVGTSGDIMSIIGRNFGNLAEIAVKIGGSSCLQPKLLDFHSRITCQIPERKGGKATNLPVQVCVAGRWSDASNPTAMFSYRGEVLETRSLTRINLCLYRP